MTPRWGSASARPGAGRRAAIRRDARARPRARRDREFPRDHPFAATKGSDNIVAFTTEPVRRTPLIVQGPGAGAEVTAMGIFSDIFKLLHSCHTSS